MDKVFIEGLEVEALIGIYDWERRIRQPLRFDLEMGFDNRRPAASDAIEDTLDYKAVSKRLIAFVQESGFGLVETLAERCAALVLDEFGVEHVRLKLSKPGAVRGAKAVGVIIERSRADRPARDAATARDAAAAASHVPGAETRELREGIEENATSPRPVEASAAVIGGEPAVSAGAGGEFLAADEAAETGGARNEGEDAGSAPSPEGRLADEAQIDRADDARIDMDTAPPVSNIVAVRTSPPFGVSFLRPSAVAMRHAAASPDPEAAGPTRASGAASIDRDLVPETERVSAANAGAGPSTSAGDQIATDESVPNEGVPNESAPGEDATSENASGGTTHETVMTEPATPAPATPRFDRERASPPLPPIRTPPPRPRNPAAELGRATRPAYLSLGSNIDARNNLRSALMALRARFGEVIASPVYRMPAIGFDGPDFLNAAAIIDSDLDPFALVTWLQGIERAHGRLRNHVRNSSRTLDMDIVYFDNLVLDLPGRLQLPRPELRHAFVLKPLADIAPGFVDPVRGVSLGELWSAHPEHGTLFETVSL